jgi:uncharacterized SAM-binding protein YcdF (DUF218 family)
MFFFLKKALGWLAMPYNVTILAFLLGSFLLWQKRWLRFKRLGVGICFGIALALFGFFGNSGIGNYLVMALESDYPPIPEVKIGDPLPASLANCKYVIVLGAGVDSHPQRSALTRLSLYSLSRLTEGIRILNMLPADAKLVVSGWNGGSDEESAVSMALEYERAAISLGVPANRILRFDETRDTREEVSATKKLAANSRVALVTTAFHMPRAMKLCREIGVDATACPTGFLSVKPEWQNFFRWHMWMLGQSGVWVHEELGKIFA